MLDNSELFLMHIAMWANLKDLTFEIFSLCLSEPVPAFLEEGGGERGWVGGGVLLVSTLLMDSTDDR